MKERIKMVKRGDGSVYRRKRKTAGSYGTGGRGIRRSAALGESASDWSMSYPWKPRARVVKKGVVGKKRKSWRV